MTSYQANFASHPTRDRHVGFLLHDRVYENTAKCLVTFYKVHITILYIKVEFAKCVPRFRFGDFPSREYTTNTYCFGSLNS